MRRPDAPEPLARVFRFGETVYGDRRIARWPKIIMAAGVLPVPGTKPVAMVVAGITVAFHWKAVKEDWRRSREQGSSS